MSNRLIKKGICVFVVSLVCTLAARVQADDPSWARPDWRGNPYSTLQEWDFGPDSVKITSSGLGPLTYQAVPDGQLSIPPASSIGGPYLPGENPGPYLNTENIFYDGQGAFTVGGSEGHMWIYIPNWIDQHPFKDLRIQLTYHSSLVGSPNFWPDQIMDWSILAYKDFNGPAQDGDRGDDTQLYGALVGMASTGDPSSGWGYFYQDWHFEPNPDWEWVSLTFYGIPDDDGDGSPDYTLQVDQIVVDTVSPVPIPPSAFLLGTALFGIIGLRHRLSSKHD